MCELYRLAGQVLQVYSAILLIYALLSWIPSIRGKWTEYVAMLVEPVLSPVRRIIPPIGGLDVSFIVVLIIVQLVAGQALRSASICYLNS
jgi:YggT family protein